MKKQSKIADATRALWFSITKKHVAAAKCKDPQRCVIAQALHDAVGDFLESFEVGASITKIKAGGKTMRFRTPKVLRDALTNFDKTGNWLLPEGHYKITPPTGDRKLGGDPRTSRPTGPHKRSKKHSRRALPTRKVSRVSA